ncbi:MULTISPECIES: flagellar brake protein [Lysinibacillus]|uniref:Glycosyltransferase n=1 Tax=Lysinibacillus antri TaxID=2498145 RepID=A0A432L781_9BACI|nr:MULTISPECIES: flagellar brake domain-containing protein [Lysinibacillus]RUL47394.1 glycosyltransferase [Lysinibacillus antri]TSI09025.1 glycosyltransferase [Lysinibacillus sp. BW-2-10]
MELKIGTSLTLETTNTEQVEKYHCKVVEQEGHVIFIDYPVNAITKKTAFLVDGAQFRASFMTEDKISYAFNTEVLGRRKGNIPTIMILCPPDEEFIKIQRREYVRVNTPADVAVQVNDSFYQYVTDDISAGGMALQLRTTPPFQDGDLIHLTIVLPYTNGDIRYVKTDANVVRVFEKDNKKLASLQFTETDDLDKQYIVRFCFERQLLNRKNAK